METIQDTTHPNQWKCSKCNTWCSNGFNRCSWCGAAKPNTPRPTATITESVGTPDEIRLEQETLNKIRVLSAKLTIDEKTQLLKYIEETFKV